MKNLGTKIAAIAQPIAIGIDAIAGTNIRKCSGCRDMKDNLNAGMSLQDAIYERWFKAKQEGEKMKYQFTIVVEADTYTKASEKAESVGDVLSGQVKPVAQQQLKPGAQPVIGGQFSRTVTQPT